MDVLAITNNRSASVVYCNVRNSEREKDGAMIVDPSDVFVQKEPTWWKLRPVTSSEGGGARQCQLSTTLFLNTTSASRILLTSESAISSSIDHVSSRMSLYE